MEARRNLGRVAVRLYVTSLFLLCMAVPTQARQLFYVLDRRSEQGNYINEIKCFDVSGTFQYTIFTVDPPGSSDYGTIATDGSTAWLAASDLAIRSFAIRSGGLDGAAIPLQTTDLPTHGGCAGMALQDGALWLSRTLTWGTPTGRIEIYNIPSRSYYDRVRTDVEGWYPGSLQIVGNLLFIKDVQHADRIYSIDTASDWDLQGPLTLTGAPLSPRALAADGSRIWLLGYSGGQWIAFAYDWSGNRLPAHDAPFTRLSQPLDMYLASGPDEPVVAVSPLSLDFGTIVVGQTVELTARIESIGTENLSLTDLELTDTDNFWQGISLDSLPSTLTPGSFTSFLIRFQPQSVGQFNEELIIRSNDIHNADVTISLSGQAMPNIWYVDPEVQGGDGTSWESAFSTIPQALTDSRVLEGAEIRVRGGEYHDTIEINKSVSLIGGWDEEGNRTDDDYYPFINGHGASIPLKITASNVTVESFEIEDGYNNWYPCRGGGIVVEGDNVTIADCWIGNNRAQYGGGISIAGSSNTIRDCHIEGNECTYQGGGVFISGGGNNQIIRTEVIDNRGTHEISSGGGIYNQTGSMTAVDCIVRGNRTNSMGGGIYSNDPVSLTNCLICDNENAVVNADQSDARGAGIYVYKDLTAMNCTIAGNRAHKQAYYGAGIYCHGAATVTNSIVWGNRDTENTAYMHQVYSYNPAVVAYSDIEDAAVGGTGVFHQDPMFIDAMAEDWWDRDYWLHEDSPCIDSATATSAPDHDLDGTPRPYGDGFDMGALEWIWRYPGPWYVDASTGESGNGQSWAQAFQTIDEALQEADDGHEIWVRGGTYHLGENSLWVACDAMLLGGFAGTETDASQRNAAANPTIMDGDHDGGCIDVMADAVIDGFTITNSDAGGGGGIDFFGACSPVVSNCRFIHNRADMGGALLIEDGSSPLIMDCVFLDNVGYDVGGAIDTDDGAEPIIVNCLFAGNTAGSAASALSAYHGFIRAYNCTFVDNVITSGDYGGGAVAAEEAELLLDSCIVWGNAGPGHPAINIGNAEVTIRYCNVDQDGFAGDNGNIRQDPLFAALGGWDDNGTPGVPQDDVFLAGDYHLASAEGRWDPAAQSWIADGQTSPSIDTGNPGSDVGSETVPHGNRVNMGAYGGMHEASRTPAGWSLPSDLTNDGKTDLNDLSQAVGDWMTGDCDLCPGDLNHDGRLDLADFALFAETWMGQTTWH